MFLTEGSANSLDKWFTILEIDKNATNEEIKKAHRRMVIKYHPDKLQGVSEDIIKLAEEKFLLVQQAYEKIMKSRS
jgi:DnaJ like chaperone protein